MKIYMIGNSFTSIHDIPQKLAKTVNATVISNTRGGATLAERLNPMTKKGQEFYTTWQENDFDYLILQDQSLRPYLYRDAFKSNIHDFKKLCEGHHTQIILYETWSYQKDLDYFNQVSFSYEELYEGLKQSYEDAAEESNCLLAPVGQVFHDEYDRANYGLDGKHPSLQGSDVIIRVLSQVIKTNSSN